MLSCCRCGVHICININGDQIGPTLNIRMAFSSAFTTYTYSCCRCGVHFIFFFFVNFGGRDGGDWVIYDLYRSQYNRKRILWQDFKFETFEHETSMFHLMATWPYLSTNLILI